MPTTNYFSDTYHIDGEDDFVAVRKDQREKFETMLEDQQTENARLKAELAAAKESGSNPDSGSAENPNPTPDWQPRSRSEIAAELEALDPDELGEIGYNQAVEAISQRDAHAPRSEPAHPMSGKTPEQIQAETDSIFNDASLTPGQRDQKLAEIGGLVGPGENTR